MTASARLKRLLPGAAILLGAGLLYAAILRRTGLYIPCLFWKATGFKCPGCGVTTLCLALLRLDFAAAWAANPVLLLLLPLIAFLAARAIVRYVRQGSAALRPWEEGIVWAMVAVLILWGILRNICAL